MDYPRTNFRHSKKERALWEVAAEREKKKLSAWMREVLTQEATKTINGK